MKRWSHVEAIAGALVARKILTGPEVIALLIDVPLVPYSESAKWRMGERAAEQGDDKAWVY